MEGEGEPVEGESRESRGGVAARSLDARVG